MSDLDISKFKVRKSTRAGQPFTNTADTNDYNPSAVWWNQTDESERLQSLRQMIGLLSPDLLNRIGRYRVETRLYGITDQFLNFYRTYNNTFYNNSVLVPDRLSMNVVQSCVDTLTAKMSKIRPRAKFLTNLGGYKAQSASKKLSYFADGIFAENDIYSISRLVERDALVLGDGFIHVYENSDNRIEMERVMPYEILVDENECVSSGKPSHMYRLKLVDRGHLMAMFPKKRDLIANSSQLFTINVHQTSPITDQIEIVEAWRLPTSKDAHDGRHIVAVPGCVLVDEEWDSKEFPFARISWTRPFSGYWSQSLAEQLKPTQLEINRILNVMQKSYHLQGSFKILLAAGSQTPQESLNNAVGTIIRYVGQPPQYITPPIIQPEMYGQLDRLIQRAYQIAGISQLSAASVKPPGITAAVALQELTDIESSRFTAFSLDFENLFVESARIAMQLASRIAEKNEGHYPVNVRGLKTLNKLDFKDIKIAEDDYTITCFAASSLPTEPAGRIQAVDDLVQRGLLDPNEQRELLNFPDVQEAQELSTAQDEYLKKIFERMLEEDTYTAPEPQDNLQLARKLCLQYYALGKKLEEGEEKLELLRQYLRDLDALEAPAPVVPNLPAPELGAQIAPAEAAQLALPAATGPLPGAEAALATGMPAGMIQ